jgi:DNA-directed RNA polymerase subunit beta'
MKQLAEDDQGFNSVYMMLDFGCPVHASKFAQLSGMRGLMAKPQKSGARRRTNHRKSDLAKL